MNNEEIQKTMEFILEQQAQFAANIQKLQEERMRDDSRLKRLEESFQLLVQLAQSTDTRLDTLETNMAHLAEAQAHTDERLSALIDIVREGRNGKAENQSNFLRTQGRPTTHSTRIESGGLNRSQSALKKATRSALSSSVKMKPK
jgi:chromosome segregation ATPase